MTPAPDRVPSSLKKFTWPTGTIRPSTVTVPVTTPTGPSLGPLVQPATARHASNGSRQQFSERMSQPPIDGCRTEVVPGPLRLASASNPRRSPGDPGRPGGAEADV